MKLKYKNLKTVNVYTGYQPSTPPLVQQQRHRKQRENGKGRNEADKKG